MLLQHDSSQRVPLDNSILDGSNDPHCQFLPPDAELLPKRKLRPKDLSLPFHKLHSAHRPALLNLLAGRKPWGMPLALAMTV